MKVTAFVKATELRKGDQLIATNYHGFPPGITVTRTHVATDLHTVGAWLKGHPKYQTVQFGADDDVRILRAA